MKQASARDYRSVLLRVVDAVRDCMTAMDDMSQDESLKFLVLDALDASKATKL